MAVSFMTSNISADFIPGGAGSSQYVQSKGSGGSQFAEMLGSQGGSEGSYGSKGSDVTGSVNSSGTVKTGDSTQSFVLEDKVDLSSFDKISDSIYAKIEKVEGAVNIPENDMDLARAIVRGDINIKDVPADRITYALLRALVLARLEKKLNDDESAIDPEAENNDQLNPSKKVDARLAILYQLIDAYVETHSDDPSKSAEGLMSRIQEIKDIMDEQGQEFDLTVMIAQIINDRAEALSEENGGTDLPKIDISEEEFIDELREAIGEENAELLEQAIRDGGILQIEKVLNKITAGEKEQPKVFDPKPIVNREVSEELEMLRSAKQANVQKADAKDEFAELLSKDETVKVAVETQGASDKSGTKSDTGANSGKGASVAAAESPVVFRADDGAEIEVQPSEVVSQAMKLVEQSIEDTADQTEYSLTLNPGELGRITVRMIKAADGAVSVTIAAENAQTQRILETNSALMQNNLRSNGVQLESWQTVSESQQETLAQDYNGSSKNPYYRDDEQSDDEQPEESFADVIAAM